MEYLDHIDDDDDLLEYNGVSAPQGKKVSDLNSLDNDFFRKDSIDQQGNLTGQQEWCYNGTGSYVVTVNRGYVGGITCSGLGGPHPPHPPGR